MNLLSTASIFLTKPTFLYHGSDKAGEERRGKMRIQTSVQSTPPRISFLVAAYNISQYLDECVNSILQHSGNEIEVILVDDGSTDTTGILCDAFAQRDPRVKVIHQENGGLSAARNTGIRAACGEWVSFIDGDDRLSEGAVSTMLKYCDFEGELVVFGAIAFQGSDVVKRWCPKEYIMSDPDELRAYRLDSMIGKYTSASYGNPYSVTSWGKLFRTFFLRDHSLFFTHRLYFSEDSEHLFRYARLLTKVWMVPTQVYEYREGIDSSLSNQWHPNALEEWTDVMDALMKTMQENHEENDSDLRKMYHHTGLFGIATRCVMQGVCHPDCNWSLGKRWRTLKKLRRFPWAAESLAALPEIKDEKLPWRSVLVCLRMGFCFPVLCLKTIRHLKRRLCT